MVEAVAGTEAGAGQFATYDCEGDCGGERGARFISYVHRGLVYMMIYSVDGREGKGEHNSISD